MRGACRHVHFSPHSTENLARLALCQAMSALDRRDATARPSDRHLRRLLPRSDERHADARRSADGADAESLQRSRVSRRARRPAGDEGRVPRSPLAGRLRRRRGAEGLCARDPPRARRRSPGASFVETAHRRGYRFIAAGGRPVAAGRAAGARRRAPPSSTPPQTRYAQSGDVNIAYQVVGDGPVDLVFVMGWVSHLDYFWEEPSFARFLRRLASFSRLILFDKRGTGLSDRVGRAADARAAHGRRARGARRGRLAQAALLGVSEGGPLCSLFAATYPERTPRAGDDRHLREAALGARLSVGADRRAARALPRRDPAQLGRPGRPRGARAERRARPGVPRLVEHLPAHGRQPRRGGGADADERRDRRPPRAADDPRADAGPAPHRRSAA